MNYNASIQWHSGMMLSSEVFAQLQSDMTVRQQIAIRLAMGAGRYGIMPDTPTKLEGIFVRRTYEMTGLQCTALLPSGRLLSVNADLQLPVSISSDNGSYFVTLEFGKELRHYEREGVPYTEPEVVLVLRTQEELEQCDAMPIKHFVVKDGTLTPDADYIIPTLDCASDSRISSYVQDITETLLSLTQHANMDGGDCKRALLHYVFSLRKFNMHASIADLVGLLEEVVQSLDYYITENLGQTIGEMPAEVEEVKKEPASVPRFEDIRAFLVWVNRYAASMRLIMDKVVIEKPTIDVEAIKREIHDALYPELREALYNDLLDALRRQLAEELPEPIIEKVKQYITDNVEPEMQSRLYGSLRTPLYDDLYEALKRMIEDMLANFEFKEHDTFVPLI